MKKNDFNKLAAKGITILIAYIFLQELEKQIERKTNKELPKEPELDNKQTWGKAITYAAFTGAFMGVFKLLVERGSTIGIKRLNN